MAPSAARPKPSNAGGADVLPACGASLETAAPPKQTVSLLSDHLAPAPLLHAIHDLDMSSDGAALVRRVVPQNGGGASPREVRQQQRGAIRSALYSEDDLLMGSSQPLADNGLALLADREGLQPPGKPPRGTSAPKASGMPQSDGGSDDKVVVVSVSQQSQDSGRKASAAVATALTADPPPRTARSRPPIKASGAEPLQATAAAPFPTGVSSKAAGSEGVPKQPAVMFGGQLGAAMHVVTELTPAQTVVEVGEL